MTLLVLMFYLSVVDCGFVKLRAFSPKTSLGEHKIMNIMCEWISVSKGQANSLVVVGGGGGGGGGRGRRKGRRSNSTLYP